MEPDKETKSNIPTIRTFEGDILKAVQNENLDQKTILSKELDSVDTITAAVSNQQNKKKWTSIILTLLIIISLCILAGGYYYYTISKNNTALLAKQIEDKKNQIKIYKIEEIWAEVPVQIKNNLSAATSTDNSVMAKISNFEELYPFLLNNEDSLITLAKSKFKYDTLDTFSDFPVDNYDLRISDAGTGPLVYGFIDKKFLIISNNISEWIKAKDSILQAK